MAQSGFQPILIYSSGTAGNTPAAANLTTSSNGTELAMNYVDGKLFYKDGGGVVQTLATKNTASGIFTTINASGQIASTVSYGTPAFIITSNTAIANLNSSFLNGATFAAPGSIGGTTASSALFTTVGASGQITSTVAAGTPPLVVTSNTQIANMNVAFAGSLSSGTANQIPYQTASNTTSFITAPGVANTYLQWTTSGFTWSTVSVTGGGSIGKSIAMAMVFG